MHLISLIDTAITGFIRTWPTAWLPIMQAASYIGEPIVMGGWLMALCAALYGKTSHRSLGVAAYGTSALLLVNLIKPLLHRPRPDTYVPLLLHSYSFPSGHSFGTALVMALTAHLVWHNFGAGWGWSAVGGGLVLTLLVGASRVYLGAHYPSDVLGGWVLAAISAIIIIKLIHV